MTTIKPYDLVQMALKADAAKVTELLVAEGYLKKERSKRDTFICPYHSEKTGSFSLNRKYNFLKCFGCGEKVSKVLQLYADLLFNDTVGDKEIYLSEEQISLEKNLLTWQAAIEICFGLGMITEDEKENQLIELNTARINKKCSRFYFFNKTNDIVTSRGEVQDFSGNTFNYQREETFLDIARAKVKDFSEINIASREDLHFVYSLLRDAVELVRGFRLFEHHKNELLHKRHLSEVEIHINGYFSHPTKWEKDKVMEMLVNLILRHGKDISILNNVPGFIYNNSKMMYEIATDFDAYFIPLWDPFGNIHREQLRTNLDVKYLYFAAKGAGNCKTPTSTIYPFQKGYANLIDRSLQPSQELKDLFKRYFKSLGIDIEFDSNNGIVVIVSEGHFKTYELAKFYNCVGISIQGLNTWSCACVPIIKLNAMLQQYNMRISHVIIAFDSDTKVKRGLLDNGRHLSKVLRNEGIETYYLTWKSILGKGFDDVRFNGHLNDVFSLVKDLDYERKHEVITNLIALNYRKSKSNLTTEETERFFEILEDHPIQELEYRLNKNTIINQIIYKHYGDRLFTSNQQEVLNLVQELSKKEVNELTMLNSQLA